MSSASLAALYRPQTFAQVVGQDMVKSVLSRASQDDRVAPAYLLSGTRGVGKTTIARIFAKALNCANAPTGEPCNECEACRRITQGSFVDVVEIDGASNRGIDDIRRLRDAVGYAPLEGRYKVFIIDEAHMLTKEAFNALLKTLEEPPARVTFIMATTEQHKFPVTIISRCQHFVFRQISEPMLESHIIGILQRENRPFEPEAAKLIARRAAGSVRDAMSLLGQTLALGLEPDAPLTAEQTRNILGLAGQEVMDRLMDAIAQQDAAAIATLVRELLHQGVDMGFFMRELGALWRDLFMLRQTGPDASRLGLQESDMTRLQALASKFSLSYIHAAWQMTLDAQRRILTSLEPASGLELLLLNLAMLPRLLPLAALDTDKLSTTSPIAGASGPENPPGESLPPRHDTAQPVTGADKDAFSAEHSPENTTPVEPYTGHTPASAQSSNDVDHAMPDFIPAEDPLEDFDNTAELIQQPKPQFAPPQTAAFAPASAPVSTSAPAAETARAANTAYPVTEQLAEQTEPAKKVSMPPPAKSGLYSSRPVPSRNNTPAKSVEAVKTMEPVVPATPGPQTAVASHSAEAPEYEVGYEPDYEHEYDDAPAWNSASGEFGGESGGESGGKFGGELSWESFLTFSEEHPCPTLPNLRQFHGEIVGNELRLHPASLVLYNQIRRKSMQTALAQLAEDWSGKIFDLVYIPPVKEIRNEGQLKEEIEKHPTVQALQEHFDATVLRCTPVDNNGL